ncbi:MAG: IS110 family transposase [Pseudomonadota bacterium]
MSRMQDEIDRSATGLYAGIDVGKTVLDVCLLGSATSHQVPNTCPGIRRLIRLFHRRGVRLIALEATGRYHRLAHEMLHEAGLAVAVINPYRSRKFADALGRLAKSDRIDAAVLAQFAASMQPVPTAPASKDHKALRDLTVARRQVSQEIGDLRRQLYETDHPLIARQIRARIKMAERHQAALEQEMRNLVAAHDALRHRFKILTSIPGIGFVTATTMLTDLCELGQANAREIAALAGLAPMNRDSGTMPGVRAIRGGRPHIRTALYMGAVSQIRKEGQAGAFYRRLVREGKKPKVALTAVMRKLVVLANTLVTEDRHWQPEPPASQPASP